MQEYCNAGMWKRLPPVGSSLVYPVPDSSRAFLVRQRRRKIVLASAEDEVRRAPRLTRRVDDPAPMFLHAQGVEPSLQVGCGLLVIIAHNPGLHAEKCRANFRNEFFL
jgi:hypothetical protein